MQLARPGKTMPGALNKKGERERERKRQREREEKKGEVEKAKGEDSTVTQHN